MGTGTKRMATAVENSRKEGTHMIRYKKARNNIELLQSEKDALEKEYANAIKELYPACLPEGNVILNVKNTFRSPYEGHITSHIELYDENNEKIQKTIMPNVLSFIKPIPEIPQSYLLTCVNITNETRSPFPYGIPILLSKENLFQLKTIKLVWKQISEQFASTIVQYITVMEKEITSKYPVPVYDVAAETVCLQDFPYTGTSGYTALADKFMESYTDYYSFYTNSFPSEMQRNNIIQLPLPYKKTMKTLKKLTSGEEITNIQQELGLRRHEYPKNKSEHMTDAEIVRKFLFHTIIPREFAKEIEKRYYRLTVLTKEQPLLPHSFPLESMLD